MLGINFGISILMTFIYTLEKAMAPDSSTLAWKIPWTQEPGRLQSMGSLGVGHDWSDFTFTFHFHALEKEMAAHSSVLAWRIPGTGDPGRLPSVGSHRVGHDWSDLAAAAYIHYNLKFTFNNFNNNVFELKINLILSEMSQRCFFEASLSQLEAKGALVRFYYLGSLLEILKKKF